MYMTLNDLERPNSLYFAFFTEFDRFSVVEDIIIIIIITKFV